MAGNYPIFRDLLEREEDIRRVRKVREKASSGEPTLLSNKLKYLVIRLVARG